jgi:hypothetical protein
MHNPTVNNISLPGATREAMVPLMQEAVRSIRQLSPPLQAKSYYARIPVVVGADTAIEAAVVGDIASTVLAVIRPRASFRRWHIPQAVDICERGWPLRTEKYPNMYILMRILYDSASYCALYSCSLA